MLTRSITRRSTLAAVTAALAMPLALTGCSVGTVGGASGSRSASEAAKTPGLNTPVTAGSFEFTALGAKAAGTTVGTAPLTRTAQGQFFQVDLKVVNTGDASQTFIVNYVKLVDAAGKKYEADAAATLYAGEAQTWIAAINPGNAVQGPILFDLPADANPTSLLVSDNAFTGGTPISLG